MATSFRVEVSKVAVEDLRRRLAHARPPPNEVQPQRNAWGYGVPADTLRELVDHWRGDYLDRWEARVRLINSHAQFTRLVRDRTLHYIHERGFEGGDGHKSGSPKVAVLCLHGWPDTVFSFASVTAMLVAHGCDVVVPSMPGYAFSEAAKETGCDTREVAETFHDLMTNHLGFGRFYVLGGDWGSIVGRILATRYPESVIGLHTTMAISLPPLGMDLASVTSLVSAGAQVGFQRLFWNASEKADFRATLSMARGHASAYQKVQAAQPQTLGVALSDSPVGLAAWILDKYVQWSDLGNVDGTHVGDKIFTPVSEGGGGLDKDALLDTIMVYWCTNTITSSIRLYRESFSGRHFMQDLGPSAPFVRVPTAISHFRKELYKLPRAMNEACFNVVQYRRHPRGGHFAWTEQPELLVQDLIDLITACEGMDEAHRLVPRPVSLLGASIAAGGFAVVIAGLHKTLTSVACRSLL